MENEIKSLKKALYITIGWLLILLITMIGSTYAWFSASGRASTNITPMGGTVSNGNSELLIANQSSGPFDKQCELILTGSPDELKPLSTADLEHFYKETAQNTEGIAVLYANADQRVDEDALHGTVYLQCRNASCDVYFNREQLQLGSDAQALAAMRLGMRITSSSGTQTFIFRLDDMGSVSGAQSRRTVSRASAVVSSISAAGQANYTDDPAQNISAYMAQNQGENSFGAGSSKLLTLQAEEIATVEYWLYLEGCDDECFNPVQNRSSAFQLAFAGVDTD